MRRNAEWAGAEGGHAAAERGGAEGRGGVGEGDGAGGRAGARGDGGDRGREGDRLAEGRRVGGGGQRRRGFCLVDYLAHRAGGALGVVAIAAEGRGDRVGPHAQRAGGEAG